MADIDPAARTARLIRADDLELADPTPGMTRKRALSTARMWSGTVDTGAGAVSGWHHHGDHETTLYIVAGRMRLESGPAGRDVVEAGPGDFLYVPPHGVHRESNPSEQVATAVIVRSGEGPPTVNVDGPAPPAAG